MKQNIYDNPVFFKEYVSLRDSGISYNDFVEQPAIKSLMPAIKGEYILDLGCGTGHFAKYCIDKGASKVIGVDISKNMIHRAMKDNEHNKIEYICMPIEELELPGQKFDLIISSLAIHYIENYSKLIARIRSLLKEGGELIFSTEHPIVTARKESDNWVRDDEGNRLHWALDNYQEEGKRAHNWYVDDVVIYHRTISTLMNTLLENGFIIDKVLEPQSIPAGLEKMPKIVNEGRRPSFIVIKSRKSNKCQSII
ncbi:bifunctional 2-polyprenyl-6-hydroxyphenol methylase/3-demethylubiquinol 3-O-methyltransferase UbiG [Salinicoccus sp. YB14-2]|uniref:class I SAM-dependent methyltransferase n=1 Tax=Salinicoccus sp. YB14-2 TaxID=1572701 RepID=UPI00068F25C5|nr:class I SAM-dependent methyltransferase [Salinicoccus sp. YB14-2]